MKQLKKKRALWNDEETEAVLKGAYKYRRFFGSTGSKGVWHWTLSDHNFGDILINRTVQQLKDRWRVMKKKRFK